MPARSEPLLWVQLIGAGAFPLEGLLVLLLLAGSDPGPVPGLERLLCWALGALAPTLLLWRRPADVWSLLLLQTPLRARRPLQQRLSRLQDNLGLRLGLALAGALSLPLLWWLDEHAAVATLWSPLAGSPRLVALLLAALLLALMQWQWQQLLQALWLLSRGPEAIEAARPMPQQELEERRLCLGLPLLLLDPLPLAPAPAASATSGGSPVQPAAPVPAATASPVPAPYPADGADAAEPPVPSASEPPVGDEPPSAEAVPPPAAEIEASGAAAAASGSERSGEADGPEPRTPRPQFAGEASELPPPAAPEGPAAGDALPEPAQADALIASGVAGTPATAVSRQDLVADASTAAESSTEPSMETLIGDDVAAEAPATEAGAVALESTDADEVTVAQPDQDAPLPAGLEAETATDGSDSAVAESLMPQDQSSSPEGSP